MDPMLLAPIALLAAAVAAAVLVPPALDPFRRHHRTMAALAAVTRTEFDTSNEGDET